MLTTMLQCDEYQESRDDEERFHNWVYEMEQMHWGEMDECMDVEDWVDNEDYDDEYHELNAMECGYTLYTPLNHQVLAAEFGFILN